MDEIEQTSSHTEDFEAEDDGRLLTFKVNRSFFTLITTIVAFVAGIGLGFVFWGRGAAPVATANTAEQPAAAAAQPAQQAAATEGPIPRYDFPLAEDAPILGKADAPIQIIEFSDFECPYCQRHFQETYPQLLAEYGDVLQLAFVDFPLTSIHPNAFPASEAAHCAQDQGAFWDYHDLLFEGSLGLSREAYEGYAEELGLDMGAFTECLDEGTHTQTVQNNFEAARTLGVQSTPTFLINGIPVVGAQPFEIFQQIIEGELNGTNN
ncbi:MAG: DsbA family protein [Anaerolineales bacterium]|nr:DsbA family protein [Anaerolineales bacterium]